MAAMQNTRRPNAMPTIHGKEVRIRDQARRQAGCTEAIRGGAAHILRSVVNDGADGPQAAAWSAPPDCPVARAALFLRVHQSLIDNRAAAIFRRRIIWSDEPLNHAHKY